MAAGALLRAAERMLPRVPEVVAIPTSEVVGTLACIASPAARRAVRANLRVIAPEPADALVRRVFVEQARNYFEVFRIPRTSPDDLLARIRVTGWEHLERAHAGGRGVIVASAHLGPISLVGQMLVARGYQTVLPVETEHTEFQRAVNRARRSLGLQLVPTTAALAIVRALREGKIVGVLADRAVTGVGERIPFFGRDALLPSAHVVLSLRTGAPLIPAFSGRDRGRLTASFEPRLELPSTGDRGADVREGVRRWARVLERYVRRSPEQWTVFEEVWARG